MTGSRKISAAMLNSISAIESPRRTSGECEDLVRELEIQNRALRKAQLVLVEGRRRYLDLYEVAPVGYLTLDRNGRIREANATAADMLGFGRERLVGKLLASQVEIGDRRRFREHLRSCLGERTQVSTELAFSPKAGVHLTIQTVSTPRCDGSDDVVGCRTTLTDVSLLKQSQERLALISEVSRLLSSPLDDAPRLTEVLEIMVRSFADAAILDLRDDAGRLTRVEQAFRGNDARGLSWRSESFAAAQRRVLATGATLCLADCSEKETSRSRPHEGEPIGGAGATSLIVVALVSRSTRPGVLTLASMPGGRRFTSADVIVAEDLASRIATAIDNARLYRRARDATRARDEVLGFAAHDLRTPLAAITYFAASLSNPGQSARRADEHRVLESVRRLASDMNRMIDDLLDVHGLDAGRLSIEREANDLRQLLADAFEALQPLAREKALDLQIRLPRPSDQVSCDRARVLRVLFNLVGNAVKFTPAGGTVTLAAGRRAAEVVFTVEDTGPGVSGWGLIHLFDRYRQADEHARKGRGLGLYIARRIVEAHGGAIWCANRPRGGTAVSFSLPQAPPLVGAAPLSPRARSRSNWASGRHERAVQLTRVRASGATTDPPGSRSKTSNGR